MVGRSLIEQLGGIVARGDSALDDRSHGFTARIRSTNGPLVGSRPSARSCNRCTSPSRAPPSLGGVPGPVAGKARSPKRSRAIEFSPGAPVVRLARREPPASAEDGFENAHGLWSVWLRPGPCDPGARRLARAAESPRGVRVRRGRRLRCALRATPDGADPDLEEGEADGAAPPASGASREPNH